MAEHAVQHCVEPMNPTTANAYLSKLSTLLRWAVREEYVDRNPAEGLRVGEPSDPREASSALSSCG